jgi:hypothetical protein
VDLGPGGAGHRLSSGKGGRHWAGQAAATVVTMTSPATGGGRALRAAALALAAVSLALAAHTSGGGERPGGLALLAAVVVLGCTATLATGRRIARPTAVVGLLGTQLGLHAWFALTSGHACSVSGLVLGGHHAVPSVAGCPPATDATASHVASGGPAAVMLTAHLGAVVLTALLLAHGEAALWRLADLVHGPVRLPGVAPLVTLPRPASVMATVWTALAAPCLSELRRRGPPAPVAG